MSTASQTSGEGPKGFAARSGGAQSFSIVQRLLSGLALTVGIVSAVGLATIVLIDLKSGSTDLENEAGKSVSSLGQILERPFWDCDAERIADVGTVYSHDPRISKMTIHDNLGRSYFSIDRGTGSDDVQRSVSVFHSGKVLGKVDVSFSRDSYKNRIWQFFLSTLVVETLVLVATYIAVFSMVRAFLNRPLDSMTRIVNAYGNGDYTQTPGIIPYVEFQRFGTVLGQMGERIQKQVQELRESEERFRKILNATPIPLALNDEHQNITYLNRDFTETFGYDLSDIPTLADWWPKAYPDAAYRQWAIETWRARLEKARRDALPFEPMELNIRCKNGSVRTVFAAAAPLDKTYTGVHIVSLFDITDRKRAEEALRLSDLKVRAIFDQTFEFIGLLDLDGHLLEANQTAMKFAGITAEQVFGKPFWETPWWTHSATEQERLRSAIREVAAGGVVRFETTHLDSKGKLHVVDFTLKPIRDSKGNIVWLVPEGRDITDRKEAESALKLSEFSVQHASLATYWIARDGRILRVNRASCDMLGYTEAELLLLTVSDVNPDFPMSRWASHWRELRERRQMFFETRHRRKDGRIIPIEVNLNWFEYDGQEYDCAFVRDITDRKQSEAALKEKEQLLSSSQRIASIGSWSLDLTTLVLTWTDETYRLYNVSRDTFVPSIEKLIALIHPGDRDATRAQIASFLAGQDSAPIECRVSLPDGTIRTLVRRGEIIRDGDRPVRALGTVQDMTSMKKMEAEQRKIEVQLRHSQKMDAIGRLAGGVAHDFNNQLAAILGYAELLKLRLSDPKTKDYAERIKVSAQRSADLTKNLLTFARKGPMQNTVFSVHRIVLDTVAMLERTIDKRIVVRQVFNASADQVLGDSSQIQNALLNLAVNARDAMPHGGELVFETSGVECDAEFVARHAGEIQAGSYIRIRVSDTGSGMSDEVKSHLFEPFFTTKDIGKGTGLGLPSVYGTVKNHNGTLEVFSEIGQGTAFTIFLPRFVQHGTALTGANDDVSAQEYPALKGVRVLLVDDEDILRAMYSELLQSWGVECMEAENGLKAIEIYKRRGEQIDLVVMDMLMPGMNGADAFRALKKINHKVKMLLSTGFSRNNEVQAILEEGVLDFVQKPFNAHELAEKMIAALA